jgi:hypothetical protein
LIDISRVDSTGSLASSETSLALAAPLSWKRSFTVSIVLLDLCPSPSHFPRAQFPEVTKAIEAYLVSNGAAFKYLRDPHASHIFVEGRKMVEDVRQYISLAFDFQFQYDWTRILMQKMGVRAKSASNSLSKPHANVHKCAAQLRMLGTMVYMLGALSGRFCVDDKAKYKAGSAQGSRCAFWLSILTCHFSQRLCALSSLFA